MDGTNKQNNRSQTNTTRPLRTSEPLIRIPQFNNLSIHHRHTSATHDSRS